MKKKTTISRFQPRRRKAWPWSFGKKTKNNKSIALGTFGALKKTMKKKTTLGALEKSKKKKTMNLRVWLGRRR
jgi:hypothetical protein